MTIEEIEESWLFCSEEHKECQYDISFLLSEVKKWKVGCQDLAEEQDRLEAEVKRLQGLYELELERAKKAEAQHFDALIKNERLREGIEKHKRINVDDFELYKLLEDK